MVELQHEHVVDFYEDAADLSRRVAAYLAQGLERGEASIVVATPEHRAIFETALAELGVDVARCRSEGLLREEDAEDLLDSFYAGGMLDPDRFDATAGELVRSARDVPGIRVAGEMVRLLWMRGDVVGAISLESAWSKLARRHDLSLCCCYDAGTVHGDDDALARLCDLHSGVVSAPPALGWVTCRDARSFAPTVISPRAGRRFVADLLARWGLAGHVDDASMIVSELSTNALLHADTPFEVAVSWRGAALRIAVRDASGAVPVVREPAITASSGRGLSIVASLARDWGIDVGPTGKTVWADLPITSP